MSYIENFQLIIRNRYMTKIFLLATICLYYADVAAQQKSVPEIGVVQDIENDSIIHTFGYRCLVESTNKFLSPNAVSEKQFEEKLAIIKRSRVPVYACNLFIPGELKVVGDQVNEKAILDYVEIVLQRAQRAGLSLITWGSGGSRRIPEGFDRSKARTQFISIAKKIAETASRYNIILALENLNTTEVNFITTVREAFDIVKAVDHKNLRLCADVYHMLKENESPDAIIEAKDYIVYCEVAEKEGRTPPGTHGEDFTAYFKALKKIGFTGKIVIECRWDNLATQGKIAYDALHEQLMIFNR